MVVTPVQHTFYSFALYIDHQILQKGQAFTNVSSRLYNTKDSALNNYSVYSSPYKQWVSDVSISGCNVPTGLYVGSNFTQKSTTGLKIDYQNGRAIFSGGNNSFNVSGNFGVKDFNIYPTTKSDEELLFESKFIINGAYNRTLTGLDSRSVVAPCIFLTNASFSNESFAFGGLDETTINIHSIILSDSSDSLDAVTNLMVDEKYNSFPVVTSTPFNFFGDYKAAPTGNYNYLSYVCSENAPIYQAYICDADMYRLNSKDFKEKNPDLVGGMIDYSIKIVRQTN